MNSMQDVYHKKINYVILGNSMVSFCQWNELLNRNDFAQRGIPGDETSGYIVRIETVIKSNPKICFIIGGINDILNETPIETIHKNFNTLIEVLQKNSIQPVIFSTLPVTASYEESKHVNDLVSALNTTLQQLCHKNNIDFIDLRLLLVDENKLRTELSYDGIHLTPQGYKIWGDVITEYIRAIE